MGGVEASFLTDGALTLQLGDLLLPHTRPQELMARLRGFRDSHLLPGLATEESRKRFVEKLFNSERKLRSLSRRKFRGSADPHEQDFHPLKAIIELFEAGRRDEAVWLAFVTTHFGQDERNTVRLFYDTGGTGCWDWDSVLHNSGGVRQWMASHPEVLQRLKFGNHRKHETNKPDSPVGTAAVIESFREWAIDHGAGSPYRALRAVSKGKSPEFSFDRAYRKLTVTRFGRTAKFDFLCLLGDLRVLSISPPHCYLTEATGPKSGALLVVTGKKNGRVTSHVECVITKLQKHLGVPVEAMEDALCNWQKHSKSRRQSSERGYVTTMCG